MYNKEEEEKNILTDRILLLILKIRKSLLTIIIAHNIDFEHGEYKKK